MNPIPECSLEDQLHPVAEAAGSVTCYRQKVTGYQRQPSIDHVIVEEPLQIRLLYLDAQGTEQERILLVTMRTPGEDKQLVTGLLLSEGIIGHAGDILGFNLHLDADERRPNEIDVSLAVHVRPDWSRINRDTAAYSSCGVCGKSSMQSLELRGIPRLDSQEQWLPGSVITSLLDTLQEAQSLFARTGSAHGCGLFDASGNLLLSSEDVGRHNALDKLIGKAALAGITQMSQKVLVVSSRLSFELVQKTLVAGIPVVVAAGAPSNLAINMARRFNLTLIGFAHSGGFNIYHGGFRLTLCQQ